MKEDVEYCRCDVTQMQLFLIDVIITGDCEDLKTKCVLILLLLKEEVGRRAKTMRQRTRRAEFRQQPRELEYMIAISEGVNTHQH
jgi:hypothetical protein